MKKYLAEMVGTMVLVLMGCGVAVSLGCDPVNNIPAVVGTAFAFGLAVVAMAYTIGGISGCHINPAITLGCFLSGRMSGKDCGMYMLFQVIGAFIGSLLLYILTENVAGLEGTDVNYDVVVDRKEAIFHALKIAEKGDIIVLAGKGHEDYQILAGMEHIHFDEREIVAEGLKLLDK